MNKEDVFVTIQWLADRLNHPDIVAVDGSWYLPDMMKDSRPRDALAEYREAHIPGAVFFDLDANSDQHSPYPHMLPSPVKFAAQVRKLGLSNGHTLVIYDGHGLFSAPRIWWMFKTMGARNVFILEGGFPAWQAAGMPVSDAIVTRTPSHFSAMMQSAGVADLADVKASIAQQDALLVDARGAARFAGEAPEPRPSLRSGHMPGAHSVPYSEVLEAGTMRPADELATLFADRGINIDEPIIATCGSGVTAVTLSIALQLAGAMNVKVYDGSWAEWASQDDTPVENGA